MRERGTSTVAVVVAAAAAGLLAAALFTNWMVVDVHTTGPDAVNLKLPVPLPLIRTAVAFVPSDSLPPIDIPPEVKENRETILQALRELRDAPDTTLVRVRSDDANVVIEKKDKSLAIDVQAPDATVHCQVPLDGIVEALEKWDWETCNPQLALRVLAAAKHGPLVTVDSKEARVAIRMW